MRGSLLTRWLQAALVALALPLGTAGCVENDQSIVVIGNYTLDDKCEAPASGGKQRGRGTLDIGLASTLNIGYYMIPRVQNFLPSSLGMMMMMGGGQGSMPAEMNHVFLIGFEVDIIADPGQPISSQLQPGVPGLTRLTIAYAGGQLTAAGGTVTAPVEVINSNLASVLLNSRAVKAGPSTAGEPFQTLTVRIRARTLRGGSIIVSNWFDYPIEVCAFCLPAKAGEPGLSGYNPGGGSLFECPDPMMLAADSLTSTCTPQQDNSASCCIKDRQVLCGLQIPHKVGM